MDCRTRHHGQIQSLSQLDQGSLVAESGTSADCEASNTKSADKTGGFLHFEAAVKLCTNEKLKGNSYLVSTK